MTETRLEQEFESEYTARIQTVGADNVVEFTRLAFICDPCGFKSSTQEVFITREDCARRGDDPDAMIADNATFVGTPSEAEYLDGLVSDAFPKWLTEASGVRTNCAAQLLGNQGCRGTVQCITLNRPFADEA